jgi:hypothetical protein
MTEPFTRLDRSLREGPPDETGYRLSRRDLEIGMGVRSVDGITPLQRVILAPRARRATSLSLQLPIAVVLVAVIAVGGLTLLNRSNESSAIGPVATTTPSASQTPASTPAPTSTSSSSPSFVASGQPSLPAISIPPLTTTFVSSRNGFSISYPAGWIATSATESWPPDTFAALGNPAMDELSLVGQVRLVIASQRLRAGQTEAQWVAAYFRPFQGSVTCAGASDLATSPRLLIDGQSGYMDIAGCPMSADAALSARDLVFNAFVFAGDRVYQITLDGDVDLAYFEAFLATMKLDPASAIDPPAAP